MVYRFFVGVSKHKRLTPAAVVEESACKRVERNECTKVYDGAQHDLYIHNISHQLLSVRSAINMMSKNNLINHYRSDK